MKPLFSKRNLTGALLSLLLVGEFTIAIHNGLLTLAGLLVLSGLYIVYFYLIDSIVQRYKLSNLSLVIVNFALYSVLITGLLHGELMEYYFSPQNTLIITLIRIQCSIFPLFVFHLLNKWKIRSQTPPNLSLAILAFASFTIILSLEGSFGLGKLLETLQTVPVLSVIFISLATIGLIIAKKSHKNYKVFQSSGFRIWSTILLIISLIPVVYTFFVLLILMITIGFYYLSKRAFRNSSPI